MSSEQREGISVVVDQNPYLAEGADTVDAVVTVETGGEFAVAAPAPERLEIIIIDCSGSMGAGDRFPGARRATVAALDELPDGTLFAIVSGTSEAQVVYPRRGPLQRADRESRTAAKHALDKLKPYGGTAMGTWLGLARQVAQQHPQAMAHAILLTDGKNEHESPEQLATEIAQSQGHFTCDCRGVGSDYVVAELRSIASALHGSVDVVKAGSELAADFQAMMRTSLAKTIPELTLRVWTPAGATVRFVKQVAPTIEDLTARRVEAGAQVGEYPLGAWGAEERDYHVQVRVEPAAAGREKLAARISVVSGAEVVGQGLVKAVWTTDTELSARISRRVAHYTGQAELAQAVQEGLAARKHGDIEAATAMLQRAVVLAAESGNDDTAKLLRNVVEVEEHTNTVRLRRTVDAFDEAALDARSTKTARVRKES
ncbi:VWA domain-containing protein [Nocardia pseudobrasiliensis]|uniref:von Willebrand factor type A domain-containing protein n=1 Tax=Nocardia pseudobrasiliensis TaxID=45979 RepID=A0A370HSS1_9NOCA|nr:VWA domain-containing protein [Nocardia pseudobrasiliensis]RDI61375.1 von Willebrand factor type A domain-containing protein [Nocardia pseudobrasiliensis]